LSVVRSETATFEMPKPGKLLAPIPFGVGLGDCMIIPLETAELFDVPQLGRLKGVILTAYGTADSVPPGIVGDFLEATGYYAKAFPFLIGDSLLGSAAVLSLPERGMRA
jgi:hypothetical protein